MLTDYKRVLCPVQLDDHSLMTLAVAKEIAKRNNGKLLYCMRSRRIPIRLA